MKIELITKLVYGQDLIYIKDEKLREVFTSLTKKKTLDVLDLENFKKIGDPITAAPIINDGSLYILTENSRILGFN